MKLQEEISSIRNKMGLSESDSDEEIRKYENDFDLAKKLLPKILKLFKNTFGKELVEIDTEFHKVILGSTQTKTGDSYRADRITINLTFFDIKNTDEIRRRAFEVIRQFTPFDVRMYGCPIGFEFYNYKKVSF